MRIFEILLVLSNLLVLLFGRFPRLRSSRRWMALLAFGVMVLQVLFEQPRWQMLPLYGLTLVLLVVNLQAGRPGRAGFLVGVAALALFTPAGGPLPGAGAAGAYRPLPGGYPDLRMGR